MLQPIRSILCLLLLLIAATPALAQDVPQPYWMKDVGVDEHPNGQIPLDTIFTNEMGKEVKLRDLMIPGKPAILQLGYFGCPMLCDTVSRGMLRSLGSLKLDIGKDYSVINLSFDTRETRNDAYLKKKGYLEQYQRPGAGGGWHFLIGQQNNIWDVTRAVGFKYKWLEDSKQFSHPAVLMILTPEGRISRYLYGVEYPEETLRLALVEASDGKIGTTIDQIIMLCSQYDTKSGRYSWAAVNIMRLGGMLTVTVLGSWIGLMLLKEKYLKRAGVPASNLLGAGPSQSERK